MKAVNFFYKYKKEFASDFIKEDLIEIVCIPAFQSSSHKSSSYARDRGRSCRFLPEVSRVPLLAPPQLP